LDNPAQRSKSQRIFPGGVKADRAKPHPMRPGAIADQGLNALPTGAPHDRATSVQKLRAPVPIFLTETSLTEGRRL